MIVSIKKVSESVVLMDEYLRKELSKKKLWEHTFIKHQIDKRKNGGTFTANDHIRAMVYSMLSSGISWDRVENQIDEETGKILPIDEVFHQYDTDFLLKADHEFLGNEIIKLHCGSQYTMKQTEALVKVNICKLINLQKNYGSIDAFYSKFITADNSLKELVKTLSSANSENKFAQMGEALVCEYLKNVGYEIAKPDRHVKRILGSKVLGCSEDEIVDSYEAIDIVAEIAEKVGKSPAEVDYILWSYCANGFGEICTVKNPKCATCVVAGMCNYQSEE